MSMWAGVLVSLCVWGVGVVCSCFCAFLDVAVCVGGVVCVRASAYAPACVSA